MAEIYDSGSYLWAELRDEFTGKRKNLHNVRCPEENEPEEEEQSPGSAVFLLQAAFRDG
jgi:hypothetical protein